MFTKTINKKIIILFLITASITSLSQSDRGFQPVQLSSGKSYYPYEDKWAVLIGINKFKFVPELKYAVKDAKGIKELLIEEFDFKEDHITMLLDEDANINQIKTVLGGELSRKVKEKDQVLIFWAGHGQTYSLPGGGEMGYLIPVEGNPEEYYATCLSMYEIRTIAKLIPAKHVLFLVDACYSGLAADQERGLPTETAAYLEKITRAKGRQIITAGGKGEEVIESSSWGHSAFTYKLIQGLKEKVADLDADGIITSTELATYLRSRVTRLSKNKQTPQYRYLDGDGEFVFLTEDVLAQDTTIGKIYIHTRPWCDVYLDGKKTCTSPYMIENVASGKHTLILRRPGYKDLIKKVIISRNSKIIRVSEKLSKN